MLCVPSIMPAYIPHALSHGHKSRDFAMYAWGFYIRDRPRRAFILNYIVYSAEKYRKFNLQLTYI